MYMYMCMYMNIYTYRGGPVRESLGGATHSLAPKRYCGGKELRFPTRLVCFPDENQLHA